MLKGSVYSIMERGNIVGEGGLNLSGEVIMKLFRSCQVFVICSRNLKRGGVTL